MAKKFKYEMIYCQNLNSDLKTLNAYGSLGYKAIYIEKATEHSGWCNILLMKEE
jgi:hypothetical protein